MVGIGTSFAGYGIQAKLGQGGMGTVYLAQHPRLPRMVALKLLDRDLYTDDELRRRFELEANIVAELDHPGIVGIYDRGLHEGHLWIAMQYVRGADAARGHGSLSVDRALRIITQTGEALDYAHGRGVLHRDVKPANILLAEPESGRDERAILTDFGIARLVDATRLTATGTVTATLAYASPEQLCGDPTDHRSDQYSLGCTLFALLAGHAPFEASYPGQVVAGHIGRPVPRITTLRPDLPRRLDEVLAVAMAKSATDRFDSCREFAGEALAAVGKSGAGFATAHHRTTLVQQPMPPRPTAPPPAPSAWDPQQSRRGNPPDQMVIFPGKQGIYWALIGVLILLTILTTLLAIGISGLVQHIAFGVATLILIRLIVGFWRLAMKPIRLEIGAAGIQTYFPKNAAWLPWDRIDRAEVMRTDGNLQVVAWSTDAKSFPTAGESLQTAHYIPALEAIAVCPLGPLRAKRHKVVRALEFYGRHR